MVPSENVSVFSPEILARAQLIQLLLLDVDGVLSDGTLDYGTGDIEIKSFHSQDGFGIRQLVKCDVLVGIITGRSSEAVRRRAKELKMDFLYEGTKDKLVRFKEILQTTRLKPEQIAYMGDDWMDLPLLNRVGLALAPVNAVLEVKERVHFVTNKSGGKGAVREVCDLLMEAKGKKEALLAEFDL